MFSERKIWNDGAPFEDFMGRDGAPPVARRHLAFGGGKGGAGGTTYQQQTTTIPPEVRARYDAINARAETAAQQPFTPYGGEFVAPLTATQQQGIEQIGQAGQSYQPYQQAATTALTGAAEAALPYYGQAGQNIDAARAAGAPYTGAATMAGLAGAQSVNPGQLEIGRYMDPYLQSVVAPTMQGLYQQQQQQQSQLMGSQAMRGAFGGDRGSIAAANLARQQGLAAQQAQAGLLSQGYGQALQTGQQQQGVGLQAGQANRAAYQQLSPQLLQIGQQAFQQPMATAQAQQGLGQGLLGYGQNVAQGLSGLGQQGAQLGLATGQAQLGAGTLEQQTQQQLNSAFYNQFQQQQGYPYQVAQFLANIGMGTGPLYGSTTTGVTGQPTPFFSDERVKEDITEIGRTHDGQKIIKFRYKNEPPGTSHIGLSAQDVEKHHPEAVSETPEGIKAVDYDAATKQAERAFGGGLMPSSEGGAVHPSMAGLGFAAGGTPGVDDYSRGLLEGLVDPRHKTTPFGGGLPGAKQSWRVAPTQPAQILGSGVQLKPPAQRPTGLSEVMGGVKDAVGAVETGEKVYKGGTKAYDWAKEQAVGAPARPAVPAAGNTPAQPARAATEGFGGYGGEWGRRAPTPTQTSAAPPPAPGLGSAGQKTAEASPPAAEPAPVRTAEAPTGLNPPEITTASLGALPTEDVASLEGLGGLGEGLGGLEGLSMGAARGGRIGYEGGGGIDVPDELDALPYGGEKDTILGGIAKPVAPAKLDAPKLDMSAGAGAGGDKKKKDPAMSGLSGAASGAMAGAPLGPWGMAGGAVIGGLAGAFSKDGGRVGYAEGGGGVDAAMMADAKRRIAGIESGGRYDALGPMVGGDRAHGKYQVMGANLPSWTQEALGRRMTPEEFLKSPEAQERVFEHHFGKFLKQHGSLEDAASMWHSGRPLAKARADGARDVNMSTEDYVRKIMGGAPPAEAHMRAEMPEPRHAGLAPKISVDDEEPMGLVPDDDENFEMPDRFNRFASGGLVGRHGYPTGGGVIDPDKVDPNDPAQVALLKAQIQRTEGDLDLVGHNRPATGVAPPAQSTPDPDRNFFDRAGDWYNSNQNWVLPLAGGIGKMLASRSPYFLNAAGEGLAEAAPLALGASQKQQGLDINMMSSLSKQINTLAAEAASRGGPGMSPEIDKAQQAAMSRYYQLSGVKYTPTTVDPKAAQAQLGQSPFKGVTFTDNPDLLARAATQPGLSNEDRMAYLAASEEAMKRIREKGFARGENSQIIPFPNWQEAERSAVFYSTATRTAGAEQGALSVPGSAASINSLNAAIAGAQSDVTVALRDHGIGSQPALDARRRLEELKSKKARIESGRAFGGRTGYATDGGVDDEGPPVQLAQAGEEPPVQLAQAYPKGQPLPPMPAPPSISRTPPPVAPPGGPTITITPTPKAVGSSEPSPRSDRAPKTIEDYHRLITEYGTSVDPATLAEWQDQRRYLMDQALEKQRVVDPSSGTVAPVPSAASAAQQVEFGAHNTTFLKQAPDQRRTLETEAQQNEQIRKLLQTYETGAWSDPKADIVAKLRSIIGGEIPSTATANPAAREVMQKIMQDRMSRSMAMAGGNKLNAMVEGLQQSQPEPTKQPEANRKVAAWMTATTNWQDQYVRDYAAAATRDQMMNPDTFWKNWSAKNQLEKYYNEAYRTTPVRGDLPIYEPSKLVVGRQYVAEKDQLGLPNGNGFGVWEYRGRAENGPNKGLQGWKQVQ